MSKKRQLGSMDMCSILDHGVQVTTSASISSVAKGIAPHTIPNTYCNNNDASCMRIYEIHWLVNKNLVSGYIIIASVINYAACPFVA